MRLKTIDESIGEANTKDQVLKDFIEDWDVACSDSEDIEYAQEAVLKTYKSNFPEVFKNEIAEYLNKWRKQYSGNIDEAINEQEVDALIELARTTLTGYKEKKYKSTMGATTQFAKHYQDASNVLVEIAKREEGDIYLSMLMVKIIQGESLADPTKRYQTTSAHRYKTKKKDVRQIYSDIAKAQKAMTGFFKTLQEYKLLKTVNEASSKTVDPAGLLADIKKITSAWTYGKVRIKHVSGQKNLLYIDLVMPEGNRVDHVAKNAGAKLAVKINDLLLSKGIDLEDFSHQMSGPVYNIFAVSDAFTDLPI